MHFEYTNLLRNLNKIKIITFFKKKIYTKVSAYTKISSQALLKLHFNVLSGEDKGGYKERLMSQS